MKKIIIYTAILLLWGGVAAAQKSNKASVFYHNITARFNGYYNADIKLKETVQQLESRHKDDYSKLLPVFVYPTEAEGKGNAGNLDEAIKKCSKVIQNHEPSTWLDECFVMIGKGYFYKADYFNAIESFQYAYTKYKKETTSPEALLWLAKSYIQTKQYREAEKALEAAVAMKTKFPAKLKPQLYATYADYYIRQNDYNQAAIKLEVAINATKRKKQTTRQQFVLGQLYALSGSNNKALNAYQNVLKANPVYDMQINTQLNMAKLYNARNAAAASIKGKLLKMTREDKNKEYLDQIYYELGNIAIKEKKDAEAIKYYRLSAATSTQNIAQKTLSYLTLAELFFQKNNYTQSKLYYDSTAIAMLQTNEKYQEVQSRQEFLGDLVRNLDAIHLQDSLINLSKIDKNRQDKILDEAVKRLKKEQELLSIQENTGNAFFDANDPRQRSRNEFGGGGNGGMDNMPPGMRGNPGDPFGGRGMGGGGQPDWYFYNPAAVAQGTNEFGRKWGNRTLEDDWRRSKKNIELTTELNKDSSNIAADDSGIGALKDLPTDTRALRTILQNTIPKNPNEIARAELKIADATYAAAGIYRDRLNENRKAIELLEKLLNRFPNYKQTEQVLYALHLLYKDLPDAVKAEFYKKEIETKFAASNLLNQQTQTPQNADIAAAAYTETYNLFAAQNYPATLAACDLGLKNYKNTAEEPKFAYLKALCAGKTGGMAALLDALKNLQQQYPNDPVKDAAKSMFDALTQPVASAANPTNSTNTASNSSTPKTNTTNNPNEIFAKNYSDAHFFVLAVSLDVPNATDAQTKLIDFNNKQYSLLNLRTNSATMGEKYQLHSVKSFANKDKALEYFYALAPEMQQILPNITPENYQMFVISQTNYTVLYRQQLITEYLGFFEQNYLTE